MTIQEYNTKVWAFYLRLERDFIESLNYVEFAPDNYATYSVEYEKQLLSICSEIDVLCKLLCKEIEPSQSPGKIYEYAEILCGYSGLTAANLRFETTGQCFVPFDGWTKSNSPTWWQAYNKVKHNRTESDNYKKGNLENVFMALAGLYVLNRYYCKKISTSGVFNEPSPKSQIFSMVGWQSSISIGNGFAYLLKPDGSMGLVHESQ